MHGKRLLLAVTNRSVHFNKQAQLNFFFFFWLYEDLRKVYGYPIEELFKVNIG